MDQGQVRAEDPSAPGIKKMSIKHDAILDFMLANPLMAKREVAAHFGVSQPWLSCIIHSDAFQREYKAKGGEIFNLSVVPIRTKLLAAADMAVDRVMELIPLEGELKTAQATASMVLDRIGFSPKVNAPAAPQTVEVTVLQEQLAKGRALFGARVSVRSPAALEDHSNGEEFSPTPASEMGEVRTERALPAYVPRDARAEEGDPV
jgi:hypothetical protein